MSADIHINLESAGAQNVVRWAVTEFDRRVALACSFSLEDIVVAHMMVNARPDVRVFSLDTGRLHEETYACADEIRRRLGIAIEWYFPDSSAVEGNLLDGFGSHGVKASTGPRSGGTSPRVV